MTKTIGIVAMLAVGGLSLQALAQDPAAELPGATPTKSECERRADAQNFRSHHSDRHWYVLRCMTDS